MPSIFRFLEYLNIHTCARCRSFCAKVNFYSLNHSLTHPSIHLFLWLFTAKRMDNGARALQNASGTLPSRILFPRKLEAVNLHRTHISKPSHMVYIDRHASDLPSKKRYCYGLSKHGRPERTFPFFRGPVEAPPNPSLEAQNPHWNRSVILLLGLSRVHAKRGLALEQNARGRGGEGRDTKRTVV